MTMPARTVFLTRETNIPQLPMASYSHPETPTPCLAVNTKPNTPLIWASDRLEYWESRSLQLIPPIYTKIVRLGSNALDLDQKPLRQHFAAVYDDAPLSPQRFGPGPLHYLSE